MKTLALMILGIFTLPAVYAGILVEPYAGYSSGKIEWDMSALGIPIQTEFKTSGPGAGLRLGPEFFNFFVAGDVMVSSTTSKQTRPTGSTSKNTGTQKSLGVTGGFKIPVLPIRIWAGYIFSDKVKARGDDLTGKGYKLGLGLKPLPLLSFNVEYINLSYHKMVSDGVTYNLPYSNALATFQKPKLSTLFFSVSVPF
jgi:hypothetical protein